jgi:hypothetical protein
MLAGGSPFSGFPQGADVFKTRSNPEQFIQQQEETEKAEWGIAFSGFKRRERVNYSV